MRNFFKFLSVLPLLGTPFNVSSQNTYINDFSSESESLKITGRGESFIKNGVFYSVGSYASFGDVSWKDYSISFKARAPYDVDQVQIWAGFRAGNRYDRYVIGLKGGLQDDVYLMRMGYMGTDEFLGVRPLKFHPIPGEWYDIRVDVCGNRIRVFVGDEELPYIDVTDKNASMSPCGYVTLGGGWLPTEFDDLSIRLLPSNYLENIEKEEFVNVMSESDKEDKRMSERSLYRPLKMSSLSGSRTEFSLNGDWLFMPDYQMNDKERAISINEGDSNWHVMSVPNFWSPIRIWLHGETMPSPNGPQPKGVSDTYYQEETLRCENYTFDYRRTQGAWYRQWLELPENVIGKNMTLTFDAISKIADVYINGKLAGSHIGMFGEIRIDATDYLKPGKNLIAVKVTRNINNDISSSGSDAIDYFYSSVRESEKEGGNVTIRKDLLNNLAHGFYGDNPAGIWQPVKLTITSPLKVEDVFIKTGLDNVSFDVTVSNRSNRKARFDLYTDIIDKETGSVLYSGLSIEKISLSPGDEKLVSYAIDNLHPRLWSPQHPNLYDFKFRLVASKNMELDCFTEVSGFRTFEVKDGFFYLNGNRYWLRGGNHTPFAIRPNDVNLANTFMQLMKQGNIDVTRTHTSPWNKLWISAADRNGIGVSHEGTWTWLMIHSTPIPDLKTIELWKDEYLSLIKKYRNHPSILFWTINNEMKFYDNDNDKERAKKKMVIISDVIKEIRKIDPTRPVCFDSNYQSKGKKEKFGEAFMDSIDDGDIDDMHGYFNWYNYSIFNFFNGEFQNRYKMPDKPLISQEMATGYPNNETGHPTRSYQLMHLNPMSLIGYDCYDFSNPEYFKDTQAFITGELAEALRRSNDKASGFMHFALLTWFRQVYDYHNIEPYPTYYALKRALQPVLVSAELWGRHFYSGTNIPTRIYVVNDKEDGTVLSPSILRWELRDDRGAIISSGMEDIPSVDHYGRIYIEPNIRIPLSLSSDRVNAKLLLKLTENGLVVSENEYKLTLANKCWTDLECLNGNKISLLDSDGISSVFDYLGINYNLCINIKEMIKSQPNICIISGFNNYTESDISMLRDYQRNGGRLFILNSNSLSRAMYPEYIRDFSTPVGGDIAFMECSDHYVFEGIDVLDLRYFNNNKREIPSVCHTRFKLNRDLNVTELASQMNIHGYVSEQEPYDRIKMTEKIKGSVLFEISDGKGRTVVSSLSMDKADTDPIAGKLLVNILKYLIY